MGFIKDFWQGRMGREDSFGVTARLGGSFPGAREFEVSLQNFLHAFKDWVAEIDKAISRRLVRSEKGFDWKKLLSKLFAAGVIVFEGGDGKPIGDFAEALRTYKSRIDREVEKFSEHSRGHVSMAFPSSDEEIDEGRVLQCLSFIWQLYAAGVIKPGQKGGSLTQPVE